MRRIARLIGSAKREAAIGCRATRAILGLLVALVSVVSVSAQKVHLRYVPPSCIGTAITTSDDLVTLAAGAANGTTFCLQAGTHRLTGAITPNTNQRFIGTAGAVISGARLLSSWTSDSGRWYASGQTQAGSAVGECLAGYPRCDLPEDVYRDNVLLTAVDDIVNGVSGKAFVDYTADRIYIWDDPAGHVVETTLATAAFTGSATGVLIRGLTIEKFANPAQAGAIAGGAGWSLENNVVRFNHGMGIGMAGTRSVTSNYIHHNGQLGIGGSGDGSVVSENEIAYNNTAGFDPYWEAGGTKFTFTNGLTLRRNFSHHNQGIGLWADIDNINFVYEYNRIEDNTEAGIQHEISYAAIIRYNAIKRNGTSHHMPGWVDGACIIVSDSTDVEVHGNVCDDNFQGIFGIDVNRGSGGLGAYSLANMNIHDNIVRSSSDQGINSGRSGIAATDPTTPYTTQNNHFERNTYYLGPYAEYFSWDGDDRDFASWTGYGNDDTGQSFRTIVQTATSAQAATTATFASPITAGNTVVVFWRSGDPGTVAPSSVTDNVGNTYALADSQAASGNNPFIYAYYKVGVTGGGTVITTTGAAGDYFYTYALEVSGFPVFGSVSKSTGTGVTDIPSGAITTSRAGILITFASQNNFTTFTAGANFFLQAGAIVSAGGAQYYSPESALTAYTPHITSDSTATYATVTLAFLVAP